MKGFTLNLLVLCICLTYCVVESTVSDDDIQEMQALLNTFKLAFVGVLDKMKSNKELATLVVNGTNKQLEVFSLETSNYGILGELMVIGGALSNVVTSVFSLAGSLLETSKT
ncbi:hypothetical protein Bhyg_03635 [Pseudolycoriella hygida]|uniref:Uncharacterized protein n=1 Tax=Pseudolycoriella hygida TaxID=35572 RepID=A0A9Q0NDQ4_9DIPT|nr:hypothetical protein Bhyg_03635 [Pseudolycoriella hygida]